MEEIKICLLCLWNYIEKSYRVEYQNLRERIDFYGDFIVKDQYFELCIGSSSGCELRWKYNYSY